METFLNLNYDTSAINKPMGLIGLYPNEISNKTEGGSNEISTYKLADYLKNNQVGEGMLVAILMRRSFEALAAILAIWKLKSAYLPMDPETPLEGIKQILKEANPVCIVSEPALLTKVDTPNIPLLTLKDIGFLLEIKDVLKKLFFLFLGCTVYRR